MDDDNDKIVEMTDKDEVKMLKAKMDSNGHISLVKYTGMRLSTRPHRNLDWRRLDRSGI